MFGYVIPDKNNMYIKDFTVFNAYYCGLCRSLGKTGLPLTKLCTNYDTTFYNIFLHSIVGKSLAIDKKRCYVNGKKKPMIDLDELSFKVADISVLLVYYNAEDDVNDGKKSRWLIKARLWARKRRAARNLPEIDKLMRASFKRLSVLERQNEKSIDMVADCFASLMRDITRQLVATDYNIDTFTYNLGRLVYLFDAVDDVKKDTEKKRYNPILLNFGECHDKAEYIEKHKDELEFLLKSTYNKMVGSYNQMNIEVNEGVLSNTIYLGLHMQLNRLLKGDEKCQTTRL